MPNRTTGDDGSIADAQFRSLLDGAYDGLFIIHPETGEIAAANETVCEWLGYEKETVEEMTIFDCQTTFSEPAEWQTFVERVDAADGVHIENEIQTREGSTVPVEGGISLVSADGAEYVVAIPRRVPE